MNKTKKLDVANLNWGQNVSIDKMVFWMDKGYNVIIKGHYGVGKTSMVREAARKFGLADDEWLYFSAATLDPWVDFVGVPKETVDPETGEKYLDIVPPKHFIKNDIKFIFLDEYNRSHRKIRNATMELIHNHSINGRVFPNLRCVWTAINPQADDDLDYDVEKLDPAQEDRFPIRVAIPYKPDRVYFANKFGKEIASAAIEWWNRLDEVKFAVSPRRLDDALEVNQDGGDIEDVLPIESGPEILKEKLHKTPSMLHLQKLIKSNNSDEAREWLTDENNYRDVESRIIGDPIAREFCVPLLEEEKISKLMGNKAVRDFILDNHAKYPVFKSVMDDIVQSNLNVSVAQAIKRKLEQEKEEKILQVDSKPQINDTAEIAYKFDTNSDFSEVVDASKIKLKSSYLSGDRAKILVNLNNAMPASMSQKDAYACLEIFNDIFRKMSNKSFDKYLSEGIGANNVKVELVKLVNTPISNLIAHSYDFTEFSQTFPHIVKRLIDKPDFILYKK